MSGQFEQAIHAMFRPETLVLILLLVREHHEATGRWMSAEDLRAALVRPGA